MIYIVQKYNSLLLTVLVKLNSVIFGSPLLKLSEKNVSLIALVFHLSSLCVSVAAISFGSLQFYRYHLEQILFLSLEVRISLVIW
jgi:hypothetical protein